MLPKQQLRSQHQYCFVFFKTVCFQFWIYKAMPSYLKSAVRHNFQEKFPDIYFVLWVPMRTTDLYFGNKLKKNPETTNQKTHPNLKICKQFVTGPRFNHTDCKLVGLNATQVLRSHWRALYFSPAWDNKLSYSVKSQENPQQVVTLLNSSDDYLKPVLSHYNNILATTQLRKHRLCLWQARCISGATGQARYFRRNIKCSMQWS